METYQNLGNIPFIGNMLTIQNNDEVSQQERIVTNDIIERYTQDLVDRADLLEKFEEVSTELIKMGFSPKMVLRTFLVHKYSSLEEGVEVLSKKDDLWNHKFVECFNENCFICGEYEGNHRSLKTLLSSKIVLIDEEKVKNALEKQNSVQGFHSEKKGSSLIIHPDSCPICFVEILTEEMRFNLSCQHKFCKECIIAYLEEEIRNARVKSINCPQGGCEETFTMTMIHNLVKEDNFRKYLKFQEREKIKEKKNVVICPILDCEGYATKPENELIGIENEGDALLNVSNENKEKIQYICNKGHAFCSKCKCMWHSDDCNEDREVKDFTKSTGKLLKRCPKCKVWTEKNEGCNHMTCQICKFEWCWLCEKIYTPSHYNEPGPCFGRQFNEDLDPQILQFIQMENNNPISFTFFFVYIYTFFLISLIVRNAINPANQERRFSKCSLFCILLTLSLVIYFFAFFFNGFLLLYMIRALRKIGELNPNSIRLIGSFTFFLLFFVTYLPGILFSTLWLLISLFYISVKICAA